MSQVKIKPDPENRLSPLPGYLEKYREKISNFGLYYQRFGKYQLNPNGELKTQHSWNNGQRGKYRESYEWSLVINQFDHYMGIHNNISRPLGIKHRLQREVLSSYKVIGADVIELAVVNISRLLTGIGEATPTEVGMVFDHNTGVPFIPASTIKGVVRKAYCLNFAQKNEAMVHRNEGLIEEKDVPGLIEIFGSMEPKNSMRGGFAFMDIYPEKPPKLAIDIMNPHFGKYYQGELPPVESEEPIPIKFLTVEKNEIFIFRGFFLTDAAQKFDGELLEAIKTALCDDGVGAKTAAGYGRFSLHQTLGGPEQKRVKPDYEKKSDPDPVLWENAILVYDKGKSELKAIYNNIQAFSKEKETIPEDIYQKLTAKKKKPVSANVIVMPIGNGFQIIKIV